MFPELSFKANVTDLSIDEILSLIRQLGNHYSSDFGMDEDRNIEIDRVLTSYHNGPYDITDIMKTVCMQNQHHILILEAFDYIFLQLSNNIV